MRHLYQLPAKIGCRLILPLRASSIRVRDGNSFLLQRALLDVFARRYKSSEGPYAFDENSDIRVNQAYALYDLQVLGDCDWNNAMEVYDNIKKSKIPVTEGMFQIMLNILNNARRTELGFQIINDMLDQGVLFRDSLLETAVAIMQKHVSKMHSSEIRKCLNDLHNRGLRVDSETWGNSCIVALLHEDYDELLNILLDLKKKGIFINPINLEMVFGVLKQKSGMGQLEDIYQEITEERNRSIHETLISMCQKIIHT